MAKSTKKRKPVARKPDTSAMRMDLDGRTAFGKPRPLVEPPPFRADESGQPVGMAADAAPPSAARRQPFLLEEPKPK